MFELSEIIASALLNNQSIIDVVGTKVFPLIADQETDIPFIVFNVEELPAITKDRAMAYQVTILSYENTYNKALRLDELVFAAMANIDHNNANYKFKSDGARPLLTSEQHIHIERKINIKK